MKPSDIPEVVLIPEVLPIPLALPPENLPAVRSSLVNCRCLCCRSRTAPSDSAANRNWGRSFSPVCGRWAVGPGRWLVGATLCFTGQFVLSYFTAVVVVGWTYRWMQAIVLRGWWRQSPLCRTMSFREFCDTLGRDGPTPRPRWFLRERIGEVMQRPGPGGQPPGPLTLVGRVLSIPVHSLWRNFSLGFQALVCDALLLGWGCLFMLAGWEFGWLNSFHKGYEQSGYGPVTYIFGGLLLIAALFYVPMAQVHQAVTGQARAFFDFRFVWRLVRARLGAYVGLAMLLVFASLVFTTVRLHMGTEGFEVNRDDLTPKKALDLFRLQLWLFSLLLLFPLLLLVRWVAAVIYRSAVLKVLRRGLVTRQELNPILGKWLDQLQLNLVPVAAPIGIGWWARLTTRWAVHRLLFTLLFFVWLVYFARIFASNFFVADPIVGFLNHPMIELPCFDLIPTHLYQGRNQ